MNFIKTHKHTIIITLIIVIFTLIFGNHFGTFLTDRGREFLIPQEILNGKVPYKDITLIYFPLAFYINALIYQVFGISINSLICTQTLLCISYMLGYYYVAKEFISQKTAFLLTILVIFSCIFAGNDLFSMITPYSYSRAYGIIASFFCIFSIIKLFNTNNHRYAYIAALLSGFALSCKLEFVTTPVIVLIGLFLNKKLTIAQQIKTFLFFLIFPAITISILAIQGVCAQDIIDAIDFGVKFSHSEVITRFLSQAGVYPFNIVNKLNEAKQYWPILLAIIFLCFIGLKLKQKYEKSSILPVMAIVIFYLYYNKSDIQFFWVTLPILMWFIFCFNLDNFYKNDRKLLFIILSSLLVAQREFFRLCLHFYGTYSFPLLIMAFCAVLVKLLPRHISNIKTKNFINYVISIFIIFYFYNTTASHFSANCELVTNKGTVYVNEETAEMLNSLNYFIEKNIDKNATILVLPEGNIINFITDRKVNLHCFMMDRLYHDAYGEEDAKNAIEKTNSDYIILLEGFDLQNFYEPYLFKNNETMSANYIEENYSQIKEFSNFSSLITVYEKTKNK